MVIDDQPGVRFLIQEALREAGYPITQPREGKEALEKIASEAPDLVILDMEMPGMSGVEFLRELRKRSFTVPVVVMTAYSELEIAKQASKYMVSCFL
ncbi:MAG TPA: response regulator [Moorella mulderi]|nr:response regulator [Moorella mulderi]